MVNEYLLGFTEDLINFAAIREHCNLWRNFYDVQDNWNNIQVGISHVITVGFAILYIVPNGGQQLLRYACYVSQYF
jgi:hypothetical protein